MSFYERSFFSGYSLSHSGKLGRGKDNDKLCLAVSVRFTIQSLTTFPSHCGWPSGPRYFKRAAGALHGRKSNS